MSAAPVIQPDTLTPGPAGLPLPPPEMQIVRLMAERSGVPFERLVVIWLQLSDEQKAALLETLAAEMGLPPQGALPLPLPVPPPGPMDAPPNGPPVGAPVDMPGPPTPIGAGPPPLPPPLPMPPPGADAGAPLPPAPPPDGGLPPPPLPFPGMGGPPPEMAAPPMPPPPPPQPPQLLPPEVIAGLVPAGPQKREIPDPPFRKIVDIRKRSPFAKRKPRLSEIMADKEAGERKDQGRNEKFRRWWDIYRLKNAAAKLKPDGSMSDDLQGEITHIWSRPAVLVDRTAASIAPNIKNLILQVDAWQDEQRYRDAAQAIENTYRTQLQRWYDAWDEQATLGNAVPPFARMLSLLMLVEGGCGARYTVDPLDEGVIYVEPVPISELHATGRAVVRIVKTTLGAARAQYREIEEVWPSRGDDPDDKKGRNYTTDRDAYPDDNESVEIVVWSDVHGLWEAIAWDFGAASMFARGKAAAAKDRDGNPVAQWIKEPTPINFGRCSLQMDPPWFGSAAPLMFTEDDEDESPYRGILTPLEETVDRISQYIGIVATLANAIGNEPWIHKYDPSTYDPQTMAPPSRLPGTVSSIPQNESVDPVPINPASAEALRATMTLLMQEVGDAQPAVLAGGGAASSGAERYLAQTAAQDYVIGPATEAICGWIRRHLMHFGELVVRLGTGEDRILSSLTYRVHKAGEGQTRGAADVLEPEDILLNGTDVSVTYRIDDPIRLLQLSNVWLTLMKENVVDINMVRDKLGIEDSQAMDDAVLRDKARADPALLKMLIGSALRRFVERGGDPEVILAWSQERLAEQHEKQMQQSGGGLPSPPSAGPNNGPTPGGAMPPQMPMAGV